MPGRIQAARGDTPPLRGERPRGKTGKQKRRRPKDAALVRPVGASTTTAAPGQWPTQPASVMLRGEPRTGTTGAIGSVSRAGSRDAQGRLSDSSQPPSPFATDRGTEIPPAVSR